MARDAAGGTVMDDLTAEWKRALPERDHLLKHAASMPSAYEEGGQRPCCDGMWKMKQAIGFGLGLLVLVVLAWVQPIPEFPLANPMLGITLLCGFFWTFEVLPIYATAMLPAVLMPLFMITSSANATRAYWRPVQILVVGTYLVNIALMQVNLPKRMALRLLLSIRVFSLGRLLFYFMLGSWTLSIFVNNVAVTLLLSPFAMGLVSVMQDKVARDEESDESEAESVDNLDAQVQNFGRALMLGIAFAANIGGLATLTGCIPNEVLMGVPMIQEVLNYRRWMGLAMPVSIVAFVVAFGVLYARYILKSAIHGMDLEGMRDELKSRSTGMDAMSRDEVLVAIVAVLQVVLLWVRPMIAMELVGPQGQTYVGDEALALFCALLLFLIPSRLHPGRPVLHWQDVQDQFNFGLLMLIGGGFAISYGFEQSGLNIAVARDLATHLKPRSGIVETFVVLILSTVATQFFSSVAASTVLVPTLHSVALNTLENPMLYLVPATVGCSFGFMLPASAAPNVIIMAKSPSLRARDFILSGFQILVILLVITGFIVGVLEGPVFDAHGAFPKWACDEVSCLWVPVPGVVEQGLHVESQACGLVDINGTLCKIWNGTQFDTAQFLNYSMLM